MGFRNRVPIAYRVHRIVFALLLLLNLYPIVWLILNSFKTEKELSLNPVGLPKELLWSNYAQAWKTAHLGTYFLNSLVAAIPAVLITLLIGALGAFFISRFEFKFKGAVLLYLSLGMLIPIQAMLVPLFIEMRIFGLLDAWFTLWFPYVAFNLSITVFILVGFMNSFPREVEEAAIIDGCGIMGIFSRIILPTLLPALATGFVLNFLYNWNDFSFALVLINDDKLKTLPLGLANFSGAFNRSYSVQMAAITLVLVPTLRFYVSVQKYITSGMTAGAVKG